MRKIFGILLALLLLTAVACPVQAAGSASMSGPGTVRAGDTITVSFWAGGGIYGGSGSVSYDSSALSLQGYSAAIGGSWAVEFAGNNFVFYDNSMANPISGSTIFTAKFKVSGSVQPGTRLTVSATGVTLSDGTADSSIGTTSYSVTVAPPLSGNNNLKSLSVSNASISPAFNPNTTEYTASVPFTTGSLNVSAAAEHSGATVSVGSTGLTAGGTTDVTVTVKAENGATKTYHIRTKRAQDPNYVPSGVNTLKSLSVEGFRLSPVFSPECLHYAVYLPYETESLSLSTERTDSKSQVTQPEIAAIPLGETTYEIPVKAENGEVRIYTLTVFRADAFDPTAESTEPPTEPATQPETEPSTEAPTESPTEEPTLPAEEVPQEGSAIWLWIGAVVLAFCTGAGLTLLVAKRRKKQ